MPPAGPVDGRARRGHAGAEVRAAVARAEAPAVPIAASAVPAGADLAGPLAGVSLLAGDGAHDVASTSSRSGRALMSVVVIAHRHSGREGPA
jgi:hypothetical protein